MVIRQSEWEQVARVLCQTSEQSLRYQWRSVGNSEMAILHLQISVSLVGRSVILYLGYKDTQIVQGPVTECHLEIIQ